MIFRGKFTENFDFLLEKIYEWPFLGKICHLQLNSRQITLFRLKSHHFRTYFLHMIIYNNVSRPVHDPTTPCHLTIPSPKSGGGVVIPPTPRIDAYDCSFPVYRYRRRVVRW